MGDSATEKTVVKTMEMLLNKFKREDIKRLVRISSFDRNVIKKILNDHSHLIQSVGFLYNGSVGATKTDDGKIYTSRNPTPENFLDGLRPGWKDSVNLCAETVTREEVAMAHAAEVKVLAWFPGVVSSNYSEDIAMMKNLEAIGVDGVCTNC